MEKTIEKFNIQLQRSAKNFVKQDFYEKETEIEIGKLLLNPTSIAWSLGVMTFLLIFANSAALLADYLTGYNSMVIHKLVKFFYVELELNAPAFFSTLLLLFASLLLAIITVLKKKQTASFVLYWSILSIGFLFMAFDEIAAVHERLIEPMQAILGEQNLGVFYFAWVVPAVALVVCLGIFFLRFLINLPVKTRWTFLIAATMYLGGAVGLEMVEGWYSEINGRETLLYITLTTLEETLEMVGTIVFIWALLGYIADAYEKVEVRFGAEGSNRKSEKSL